LDPQKPATLVIRMPSSYVYLSGKLELASKGNVVVSLSENNGLDWKPVANAVENRIGVAIFDLQPLVERRYDYRLRFELTGADAAISRINVTHDIQNSQRALPILDKGDTKISFSTGPQEGTITLHGDVNKTS